MSGGGGGGRLGEVLGKLLVPGCPTCTNMDSRRATTYGAYSRCGGGCLDIFSLVCHVPFSFSGRRLDLG